MPVTNFFWDGDNLLQEYDDAGTTTAQYSTEPESFGNVSSQRRSGQSHYYHHDPLGSTTELTDASGNVTDTRRYKAFGGTVEQSGSTTFPFQYVGQKGYYLDIERGTTYARRRDLRTASGRWTAVDPIRDAEPSTYAYVGNNPVNALDPSGLIVAGGPNDLPGEKATKGAVCAVAAWTKPLSSHERGSDELYNFMVCQARCVGTKDTRHLGISSIDDLVKLIDKAKCCTLYFCGHQGGDKGNLGGAYTYGGESGDEPVFIFGPRATGEKKVREAFIRAGCKDCVINIYACGGAKYTKEEAEVVKRNRQAIANKTGCKVCGSIGAPPSRPPPPGEVDPGVLGTQCPGQAGRPPWSHECVDSDRPIMPFTIIDITQYRIEIIIKPNNDKR